MNSGIVMDIEKNKAYVFTDDCQLIRIKKTNDLFIGQRLDMNQYTRSVDTDDTGMENMIQADNQKSRLPSR
ncbi:MAG: Anti-sigma factor N-terminus, partial [Clostridiales bacterium]|nr:Anti-sigma factor N-terminus [Clostridiales bacterium]